MAFAVGGSRPRERILRLESALAIAQSAVFSMLAFWLAPRRSCVARAARGALSRQQEEDAGLTPKQGWYGNSRFRGAL
jgi:hypothetical protein